MRFFVDAHDYEVGRRAVVHQFPQREAPISEDLGREADRIRVQAYVLGEDYMRDRDRLIDVCRERRRGASDIAGTLIHPYLGTMEVICTSCRLRESRSEGGIARFDLAFAEVGEDVVRFEPTPGPAEADQAVEAVSDAADAAAVNELVVAGPESVREATQGALEGVAAKLQEAQALFTGPAGEIAAFASKVSAITAQAGALATAPANLVTSVRASIEQVFAVAGSALDSLFVYETLFGVEPVQSGSGSSPAAVAADGNAAAVASLVTRLAVGGAVRSAARVSWESLDAAQDASARLAAQVDAELDAAPDAVYAALMALRASLTAAVPPPGQSLPRVLTLTLSAEEPALVTAWRLYADAGRADEIASRNRAPFPGLLPAGVPLLVLDS